eukprot:CAMPEP_0197847014 /NCGR_PEP_ID=MMETSP1438-20131217/4985_1 /TAXON_ID=1461541 /ORGANISM="Pterosperma sp., Strain CCMP1384" /LENGTH=530 /DNA_ID=CAMNT_0043458819 /DNA_START=104 /DNA_END=1696 /DNA_ORIENTATION=+
MYALTSKSSTTVAVQRRSTRSCHKVQGKSLLVPAKKCLPAQLRSTSLAIKPRDQKRAAIKTHAVAADMEDDELELLEKVLKLAKERKTAAASTPATSASGYDGPSFNIQTFNAISSVGLKRFPGGKYCVSGDLEDLPGEPMSIMLRSHKLQEEEVAPTVRCIARCGAGTNNIPVARMTELGIPVFNTPGANANAVKELVVCGMLLASRGIVEGAAHVKQNIYPEEEYDYAKSSARIEKDKKMFVGQEISGRTLGVIGLGHIGSRVVNAALALGMNVIGYDPVLSLEAAWRLPGDRMTRANSLEELMSKSDYISLHVPYIKDATHHLINAEMLSICKPNLHILNFARGEIVDGAALKQFYDSGKLTGKYISDFADVDLMKENRQIVLPHLGASTGEAEENSAAMAADTIQAFLETGTIRNSVNFPAVDLAPLPKAQMARLCIVNNNAPGVLGQITTFLGNKSINISQQLNVSRGNIAYTVIDMDKRPQNPGELQDELVSACEGIISSRFIGDPFDDEFGQPGTFFKVTWNQ